MIIQRRNRLLMVEKVIMLSVIVPFFNVERYAAENLRSLVQNAAPGIEFVLVDEVRAWRRRARCRMLLDGAVHPIAPLRLASGAARHGLMVERLTPFHNSNRIPVTVAYSLVPDLRSLATQARQLPRLEEPDVTALVASVGYAMLPLPLAVLRPESVAFLTDHYEATPATSNAGG